MDKDASQTKLYEHYLGYFLPEGMLDFFELTWMETESLPAKERMKTPIKREQSKLACYAEREEFGRSQRHCVYRHTAIYLDERDNRKEEQQDLRPNGFTEPATVSDFPMRDRRVELHIRRRR